MAKEFRLQVYTQEKQVYDKNVTSIIVPATDGYRGVLADHAPMIAALGEGTLTIRSLPPGATEPIEKLMHIRGGFLEMVANVATVLADEIYDTPPELA
jgi:F-type H+-transporting ATPase subunit epsilon